MLLDCGAKTVRRCGREGHLRKGQLSRNVTGWVGFAGKEQGWGQGVPESHVPASPLGACGVELVGERQRGVGCLHINAG